MIEVKRLSKAYGGIPVLNDLSFQIPKGTSLSIMGPSGSGKTTLLRLMLGLETADSGEFFGLDRKKTRAVFQEDRLIDHLSARENVALALNGTGDNTKIEALLGALKLPSEDRKPVRAYSGGMKRRVAIARALICEPTLLLLDEPFTGLDDELKADVTETILKCARGATIAMVTHSAEDARALSASSILNLPGKLP